MKKTIATLIGTGVNSWNYTDKVMQKSYENGRLIKLDNPSKSVSYYFPNRVHAGVELKPRKVSGISVSCGWDLKMGNFGCARLHLNLNKSPIMVRN